MTATVRTLLFGGDALGGLVPGLLTGQLGARVAWTVAACSVVLCVVFSPVSRLTAPSSAATHG